MVAWLVHTTIRHRKVMRTWSFSCGCANFELRVGSHSFLALPFLFWFVALVVGLDHICLMDFALANLLAIFKLLELLGL